MVIKYRDADSSGESKRVWQDSWGEPGRVFKRGRVRPYAAICRKRMKTSRS